MRNRLDCRDWVLVWNFPGALNATRWMFPLGLRLRNQLPCSLNTSPQGFLDGISSIYSRTGKVYINHSRNQQDMGRPYYFSTFSIYCHLGQQVVPRVGISGVPPPPHELHSKLESTHDRQGRYAPLRGDSHE